MNVERRHLLLDEAFDAARHGGFDVLLEKGDDYLTAGCEFPTRVIIRIHDWSSGAYRVDATDPSIASRLGIEGPAIASTIDDLRAICSRAYSILRSLPSTPLTLFQERTRGMPQVTEVERQAVQRVGQDLFRAALEDFWGAMCPMTGIADRALLRASHIRAWAACESDADRLDVFNGFLLASHLDAAFDQHLISFAEDGAILFSPRLSARGRSVIESTLIKPRLSLDDRHRRFLDDHRRMTLVGDKHQTDVP